MLLAVCKPVLKKKRKQRQKQLLTKTTIFLTKITQALELLWFLRLVMDFRPCMVGGVLMFNVW